MSVLAEIVARKRVDLAERPGAERSLSAALGQPGLRFILEVKRASPSAGVLRGECDPGEIAAAYDGVADAISVVTEPHWFGGSLDDLRAVRRRTRRPILCKDFFLDPVQVAEARAAGADAVLLMLSVLSDAEYRACAEAAVALGVEVLTEVHDEVELARALALGAPIIGINNRNLHTLVTDLATTERLAPLVPAGRLVVAESGIGSRADAERLAPAARAFLVGSSLMRSSDPGLAARRVIHGDVKVCGLTRPEDARAAFRAGATMGGLILAAESPRRVTPEQAARIREAAPLHWVGVFANQPAELVAALAARLALAAVQLHGNESPEDVATVRRGLPPGCEVWKAVSGHGRLPRPEEWGADRLLVDGANGTRVGGSGRTFDWGLLDGVTDRSGIVLAGGLSAENASQALARGCGALDVNSGVESEPGIKSEERMGAFFEALRQP